MQMMGMHANSYIFLFFKIYVFSLNSSFIFFKHVEIEEVNY